MLAFDPEMMNIPSDVVEKLEERVIEGTALLVKWAPQQTVLQHSVSWRLWLERCPFQKDKLTKFAVPNQGYRCLPNSCWIWQYARGDHCWRAAYRVACLVSGLPTLEGSSIANDTPWLSASIVGTSILGFGSRR
jgi:hypothetical protein